MRHSRILISLLALGVATTIYAADSGSRLENRLNGKANFVAMQADADSTVQANADSTMQAAPDSQSVTSDQVVAVVKDYIQDNSQDKKFVFHDTQTDEDVQLTLITLHSDVEENDDGYVAAGDFSNTKGTQYTLDFQVVKENGELSVDQVTLQSKQSEEGAPQSNN